MTDTHISERYEFRNIKQNEAEEAAEIEGSVFRRMKPVLRSI